VGQFNQVVGRQVAVTRAHFLQFRQRGRGQLSPTGVAPQHCLVALRLNEIPPYRRPATFALNEIIGAAEDGAFLHRHSLVSRNSVTVLGQHLAVGDVKQFDETDKFHPARRVFPKKDRGRLHRSG
jgi:hypothetical protein